jgi:tetratricopeptide (TPR) repeat protein
MDEVRRQALIRASAGAVRPPPSEPLGAQELSDAIAAASAEGDHHAAAELAVRLLALRPAHPRALRALMRAPLDSVGLRDQVGQLFRREPGHKEVRNWLIELALADRDWRAVIDIAGPAGRSAPILAALAEAYLALREIAAAAVAWRDLIGIAPRAARHHPVATYLAELRADALEQEVLGHDAEALAAFSSLVEADPLDPEYGAGVSRLSARLGRSHP